MTSFIKNRDKILKNLESPEVMIQVMDYCKKYNIDMPQDTLVILAGLHKARLYVTSEDITEEMKEKSKLWLKDHGFKEKIY